MWSQNKYLFGGRLPFAYNSDTDGTLSGLQWLTYMCGGWGTFRHQDALFLDSSPGEMARDSCTHCRE